MAKNTKQPNLSLSDYFAYYYTSINNNKFFAGIVMLIMNIGAKYATIEFSKTQEQYLKNVFSKQLIIFATAWVATHDIIISILLTSAFVVLSDFLINPESQLCILPERYKTMHTILESKSDEIISDEEIAKAKATLEKAKKQDQRINFIEQML
ncbi:MAG: hypothetical protein ACXABD_00095 [Candidatus Thorarchaeota archaeon]|jgi:hypothetical protein